MKKITKIYRTNKSKEDLRGGGGRFSMANQALMIGVAMIIVGIAFLLAYYMPKQDKTAINRGTSQYNKILEDYQDLEKIMYDRLMVSGQEVTALIKKRKEQGDEEAVRIKTKALDYVFYKNYYGRLLGHEKKGIGKNGITKY